MAAFFSCSACQHSGHAGDCSCKTSKGKMWQHDLVCRFVLITVRGLGSGAKKKKKYTPSCQSWVCAAVSTPNSQLNVSCIGCRREKLWFSSSVCCKNLQACQNARPRENQHTHTGRHTRTHQIIMWRRAPAALASTPVLVPICRIIQFFLTSHSSVRFSKDS